MAKEKGNGKSPEGIKAQAEKNAEKQEKKDGLRTYFREVGLEMKKVVWPTKKELGQYTVVVLATCVFFALMFWGIDSGFLAILRNILGINM